MDGILAASSFVLGLAYMLSLMATNVVFWVDQRGGCIHLTTKSRHIVHRVLIRLCSAVIVVSAVAVESIY